MVIFDYPTKKLRYLDALGVDFYVKKPLNRDVSVGVVAEPAVASPTLESAEPLVAVSTATENVETLCQRLELEVRMCTECELHTTRTQTVFGVGDLQSDWMLIGEAPGFEEDKKGEPFVGRAGQLLNRMLAAIKFERRQVYIANVIKCRPPDNRNPRPTEIAACANYLKAQIKFIQPKIILALGGVAAKALLQTEATVGRLRGQVHTLPDTDIPVVVTYHPAYLLRSPEQKSAAWEDLQLACKTVGREII